MGTLKQVKQKPIDILKTGPASFRELQQANQSNFSPQYQAFVNDIKIKSQPTSLFDAAAQAQQDVASPLNNSGTPWGKSKFDATSANDNTFNNLGDIRAENEPWYDKIGAGISKGAVLAGTTFLDGTLGLLYGAGTAISQGRISGIWDNDFSKSMQSINNYMEKELPNYYTQKEQQASWYSPDNIFTANFLGDKFLKNLGFSIGAFYSGGVTASGLKLSQLPQLIEKVTGITNAASHVTSAVGATISAVNEGRIEALNNSGDWYKAQKTILDDKYKSRIEAIQQQYQANANRQMIKTADGTYVDPAYLQYKQDIAREQNSYQGTLRKMNEDRLHMGNVDLLMNLPILTASNLIQFGKMYANGFKTARKAANITGEIGNYVANTSKAKAALAFTKSALSEGNEELLQQAASNISGDYYATDVNNYYKAKTDPKAAKDTLSWTKAFAQGMNETLNDNSSWEQFLIGSMTGALGMPRFRSIKNAEGNFQSPVTIEEGAYNQFKDYREEAARTQGVVDYLNSRVNSPDFKNYYQGLVRHNKFQNDMNQAVDNNDDFNFKNAEHSQLVSDVAMFAKAGKLEDLNTLVKAAYDTSDDNLKSITENTTTKTSNGISGPFVDSSGNPMYATEAGKQEMIDKLTKSKDEIMKEVSNYSKIRDQINASTNETLTDDQLDELTWMSSQIGNFKDRSTEMAKDIKTSISKVIGNLSSKVALTTQIRNQEGKEHADLTPVYRQSDKAVINLTKTMDSLKSLQSQSDDSMLSALAAKPEIVDYLNKQISNLDESVIDKESKKDVNQKLNDILKLSKAIDVFSSKLDEYTSNPAKQQEDHAKIDTDKIKEEETNKKASIKDRLRNAKDLQEYRSILSNEEDNTDDAIKDLQNENHDLTIANKNINSKYRNLQSSILNNKDIDDETKQDALDMLDNHYNRSQSLDEFNNQNSANLNDEDYFNHDTGFNEGPSNDRFQKAKYTIDKAFEKTAKDNKFHESLAEQQPIQPVVDKDTVRGVDKEETGDSKTATIPTEDNSNEIPETVKEIPVGNYSIDEVKEENKNSDTNDKKLTSKDNSQYYIPAVPELDIEASRNGDYRNFDEVKKEQNPKLDFSKIYNYLSSNNAFSYVNEGNLKEGDRLGFMIDPNFSDTTIFIVDKRNNQIVGSLFESDYKLKQYEGLQQLVNKIYQEYKNREDRNSKFIATPTTRVSQMLVGRIPYIADEKNLKNVIEEGKANSTIFGIVKNGSITTNEAIPSDQIMMHSGLDGKEGRLYMLLPNAAGKYSPVAVRVKHFNAEEFNLDDATVAETPMGKSISKAINDLARSSSQEDITNAMVNLIQDIHLQDEIITPIESNNGRGILISSKVKGADGKYEMVEIDGKQYIKETRIPIYFTKEVKPVEKNGLSLEYSSFEEADIPSSSVEMKPVQDIVKEITNALYSLNKPLQVSTGRINQSGYNARIINSNILSSNINSTKIKGSFFTTDYFDKSGNLHAAITVANNRPSVGRKIETVVGGKESVIPGTPVNLNNIQYYVDLSTKEIRDKFNNKVTTNQDLLLNLAWVRNNYGRLKSTGAIKDNKVLLPDGRALDISKQKILSGKEYDKFIDSLDAVKESTEANYQDGLKAVQQMQENQKLVDSQTYSILEDDGNYYDYTPAVDRAQSRDTILDNGLHPLILQFFNSSEPIVQPDTMTKKAYWALVDQLNNIKEALENRGERFISNNITLFYKYPNGDRIAAKVDIMTMDKDGRFRLYAVRKESQNKDDIQKITKELSIMSNLFSSQYNLPIYSMAIIPFSVKTRGSKVSETKLEKGISIKQNASTDTPAIGNIQKAKSTLPIFESSLETLKPINDVNTDNRSLDTDTIGYFQIEGKLHTGYLMPIGNIEGNELYLTRTANMTKGFKDTVAHAATYNYFVVFPNGETFNIKNNSITKDPKEMAKTAINLLSKNPNRVKSMSTSDTLLYKKGEEVTQEVEKPKLTAANLLQSSNNKLTASQQTVLKEKAVADVDEEFEDDLDLDDITNIGDSIMSGQKNDVTDINNSKDDDEGNNKIDVITDIDYDSLSDDARESLTSKGWTKAKWNKVSIAEKQKALNCLGF